jgi:hypothetical protein
MMPPKVYIFFSDKGGSRGGTRAWASLGPDTPLAQKNSSIPFLTELFSNILGPIRPPSKWPKLPCDS